MRFGQILFVGEAELPEFREPWRWLAAHCAAVRTARSSREAVGGISENWGVPQLIVLAQARPGQFRQSDVEALHRAAPLARLIALLGSWCEGETCSGAPWTGVLRLYWHEFVARLQRDSAGVAAWSKTLSLPRTATEAEQIDACCRPLACRRGAIAIAATHHDFYTAIAGGCHQAGYTTRWVRPDQDADNGFVSASVWDDSCLQAARPLLLRKFVRQVAHVPTVALLHFPRRDDWQRAIQEGATDILGKPFSMDDLLSHIAQRLALGPDAAASSSAA